MTPANVAVQVQRRVDPVRQQDVVDDGQVAQTQKIKFDQADLFDDFHVELGHHLPFFAFVKRKIIDQRPIGNDNPGGMGGSVPRKPLEHPAYLDQLCHVGIFFRQLRQARFLFQGRIQADMAGQSQQ